MKTIRLAPLSLTRQTRQIRQRGVALIMSLIMLVVVTLTALTGMRNTSLQERLAGNLYDRSIALQTADLALSEAESWLLATARSTILSSGRVIDCSSANATCPAIPASTFDAKNKQGWTVLSADKGLEDNPPQYHIQYLGLKNSDANTSTAASALSLQYGATGGGSDGSSNPQNATYRIIARSSQPTVENDRAVVVVSSLLKGS